MYDGAINAVNALNEPIFDIDKEETDCRIGSFFEIIITSVPRVLSVDITSVDAVTVMLKGRLRRETQRTSWRLKLEPDESHAEWAYRGTIQPAD